MKKIIITTVLALLCATQVLNAIPAKPTKYQMKQPDGTVITLQRHGDEFYHWTTNEKGVVVARNEKGYYVPSGLPKGELMGGRRAAQKNAAAIRARHKAPARTRAVTPTVYQFPVILVEFSDVKFHSSTAQEDFYRLANQRGYSDNGATGSVHDYFWDNSLGQFDAQFDVFGPYTFAGDCADYSEQEDAARILWDVISTHDDEIDWSKYDNDGDGYVDMVFMFYAGWNKAEGEDNTIWPHMWYFEPAGITTSTLDGKRFDVYACTSELKGNSEKNGGMCGIGACAHEFSHTQGLPDFYDTNYAEDGMAGATYEYDIMCTGSYNNESRTPPYFTAQERVLMGWLDELTELPASGSITIPSVDSNYGAKMMTLNTSGDGEYFILECRSGEKWDSYVYPGLIVYHVDRSNRYTNTYHLEDFYFEMTGYETWNDIPNLINANGSHPGFYIIPAIDQEELYYYDTVENKPRPVEYIPFPGAGNISQYVPVDWSGFSYGLLSDITFHANGMYDNKTLPTVTMTRSVGFKGIAGKVMNSQNQGIAGAKVRLYMPRIIPQNTPGGDGIHFISGRISANFIAIATTDNDGNYRFELPNFDGHSVDIEVRADGYITAYEKVSFNELPYGKDIFLRRFEEPVGYTLQKYTAIGDDYMCIGVGGTACNIGAALSYKQEELLPFVGRKINKIGYFIWRDSLSENLDGAYVLIDAGSQRHVISVPTPRALYWTIVDVSEENLFIQPNTDYHFGYLLENCTIHYPIAFAPETTVPGASELYYSSNLDDSWRTEVNWMNGDSEDFGNLLIYVELGSGPIDYNSIANPGYGNYRVGDSFALVLNEAAGARKPGTAIQWFFDDEPVSGSSVLLKYPGRHVVEARFTTTEGKTKVVELELNVQP